MDAETVRNGLMLLQWLTTCALAWYAHNISKQKATTDSIKALELQLAEKCRRIDVLETQVKIMPTAEKIDEWIVKVHARIDEMYKINAENNMMLGILTGEMKRIPNKKD